MNEKIKQIIQVDLPNSHFGKALEEYLAEEIERMVDVTTAKDWNEVLGRQEAVKIIKKIFRFLNVENIKPTGKEKYN